MSDCCTSRESVRPQKQPCPACNTASSRVEVRTLLHHLKAPWKLAITGDDFFICEAADCDVVYFSVEGFRARQEDLRHEVGQKSNSDDAVVCYCFGVTRNEALENPKIRDFVVEKTRDKQCACDIRNPSGRCCLKDFPQPI